MSTEESPVRGYAGDVPRSRRVTAVVSGDETSEKEIAVYVYTQEGLEALRKEKTDPH